MFRFTLTPILMLVMVAAVQGKPFVEINVEVNVGLDEKEELRIADTVLEEVKAQLAYLEHECEKIQFKLDVVISGAGRAGPVQRATKKGLVVWKLWDPKTGAILETYTAGEKGTQDIYFSDCRFRGEIKFIIKQRKGENFSSIESWKVAMPNRNIKLRVGTDTVKIAKKERIKATDTINVKKHFAQWVGNQLDSPSRHLRHVWFRVKTVTSKRLPKGKLELAAHVTNMTGKQIKSVSVEIRGLFPTTMKMINGGAVFNMQRELIKETATSNAIAPRAKGLAKVVIPIPTIPMKVPEGAIRVANERIVGKPRYVTKVVAVEWEE